MTAKQRDKIKEALADKTNQVFKIVDETFPITITFEVYNADGELIIAFEDSDCDQILFNAKVNLMNDAPSPKSIKRLAELQEKNKDVEPMYYLESDD